MNKDLPTPHQTEIWIAMNLTTRSIQARIGAALKAAGLPSLKWYDVLWSIELRGGQVRPVELAEDTIFEQSSISHLGRRLVSEGLIEIVGHSGDRRGKILQITEKGRALRKEMWAVYGPMLREEMSAFDGADGWRKFVQAALAGD